MTHFTRRVVLVLVTIVLTAACAFSARPAAAAQTLTIYIFGDDKGINGPDGKPHEAFVPASFVVKAGEPVTIKFINYSDAEHNFVEPKLNIDLVVGAAKQVGATVRPVTTTTTFTPAKQGVYRWFCSLPCDKRQAMWAMSRGYGGPSQEGFMAGNIVVI
jgi:plastocyanin